MRKRGSKWLALCMLVVLGGLAYGAPRAMDRVLLPWAYEHDGKAGLPGTWVGSVTTATGKRFAVLLNVELKTFYGRRGRRDWRNSPNGSFVGTLRSCDDAGVEHSYAVSGKPSDRRASKIVFHAAPTERPPHEGLTFSWIDGAWDGNNRLDLNAGFFWGHNGASISGPDYPDSETKSRLAMSRGADAEFRAACAR